MSKFFQSTLFKQTKAHLYRRIRMIILDYCDNLSDYKQFSYKISPYIFDACDGKITDKKIKNILLQTMDLLEMYIDDEITTSQRLKENLRCLIAE